MIIRNKILFISMVLFFAGFNSFSQSARRIERLLNRAEEAYQSGDFSQSVSVSNEVLALDSLNFRAYLLLADIYNSIDSTELEIKHLKVAKDIGIQFKELIIYRLGKALFSTGEYEEALKNFMEYQVLSDNEDLRISEINRLILDCEFSIKAKINPVSYPSVHLDSTVNTFLNEYWPCLSIDGNQLYFTRLVPFTQGFQEELFYSIKMDGLWSDAFPMEGINSYDNEGALTIRSDGNLMFFSACNRRDGFGSCDIYFSVKTDGKWQTPRNAGEPLNSTYWESHPSISANGRYLYFSSNRKEGKGGKDLWRINLKGFGNDGMPLWGESENLGDSINTSSDEISPYIHFNGKTLYFSSDGRTGMGGMDIYYSEKNERGIWSSPVNMGYPVNSNRDDQGLIVDAMGIHAFYSSDKIKENGMDIYSFELFEENRPLAATYVICKVFDQKTGEPLSEVEVSLSEIGDSISVETFTTGLNGSFLICLPLGSDYIFDVSKEGYLFYSNAFELENSYSAVDPFKFDIYLKPVEEGATMVLRNIYYQTDSYELLDKSIPELQTLINFLKENQALSVEIGGHTDNVGEEAYNLNLSENRAKSVYSYLIENEIDPGRLFYKGYGFSLPVAENLTEQGRSLNRRTEIKIINTIQE